MFPTELNRIQAVAVAVLLTTFAHRTDDPRPVVLNSTERSPKHVTATAFVLPQTGAPLVDIRSELMERAQAGDASAASRLFRDTMKCIRANEARAQAEVVLSTPPIDNLSEEQTQLQEAMFKRIQSDIQTTKRLCEGTDEQQLADSAAPVAKAAAQLGDLDAATCYIGPGLPRTREQLQPDAVADYQQNSLLFVKHGIENGDWRFVGLMAHAYAGAGMLRDLFALLVRADPKRAYAYTRLLREGAQGEYALQLDRQLAAMAQRVQTEDIKTADGWAQNMYQQYFLKTDPLEASPGQCNIGLN